MGGPTDRDVSVLVGRWAWLDGRALVEDHGAGKGLLRVTTHFAAESLGIFARSRWRRRCSPRRAPASRSGGPGRRDGRAARRGVDGGHRVADRAGTAILHRGVEAVATGLGMIPMKSGPARPPLVAPSMLGAYGCEARSSSS